MALTKNDRVWIVDQFNALKEHITTNRIDIAVLKTKAGIFGLVGGMIPIAILLCIYWLSKGF